MLSRTKLLLLAVVLLLIAIPVAYACLTWTVRDPLRFRLLGHGGPVTATEPLLGTPIQLMRFDLEVQNTSSVPMHVFTLYVTSDVQSDIAPGVFVRQGVTPTYAGWHREHALPEPVPARGTARLTCYMPGESPSVLTTVQPGVGYDGMTQTQVRFMTWLDAVYDYIAFMEDYLPSFDGQQGAAPLEIPGTLSVPSSPVHAVPAP
ncbi:hypothetical protein DES53_11589 [Roseimicrobium gellanilyticum]|uniref:Uncharacterized protein n=1 Tax=Roseimicrobium gellanilyticum TaxID=748857 RepID=A0A366H4V9_9BACT|nr:hypothetical protein [Roseimicrobium gellanilyticum]RBP36948.1 hypothetical protein DES53_11589 [Roseimicrobium gellanilyticum]